MMKLFKKTDPKEELRKAKQQVNRGVRDVDRELTTLKREEAKLVKEIKAAAKRSDKASATVLAKQLVRLRGTMTKLVGSKAQLQGVNTNMAAAVATQSVIKSMEGAGKVMGKMNGMMDPAEQQKNLMEFAKANEMMDMKSDMINDAIDGALDGDDVEEETDELVNSVLDEIGVDTAAQMASVSAPRAQVGAVAAAQEEDEDDELVRRMAALRA